ncbi:hypothetical protein PTKIN_Ptkin09bG0271600 [Pterospermum kingtungense]
MGLKGLWVVVLMSVLYLEAGWGNGCAEQDRLALLQLKSFFNFLPGEEGSDCCQWKWVECNITTGRVTSLSLNQTEIELRSLYLNWNQIAGCVENEGFGKLSKLSRLEILDLSYNYFNASKWLRNQLMVKLIDIIFKVARLSFLETLDLGRNNLEGIVEIQDFYNLTNLKKLDLRGNRIESIHSSNGNGRQLRLVNLEELDLSYNLFNNSILAELSGFSNLKFLNLRSNQLKESIDFNEFSALRNLETLDMSYNEVNRFATSKENRYLRKLKILYLDNVSTKQSFSPVSLLEPFSSIKTLFLRDNSYLNETIVSQELHVLRNVEDLILDNTALGNNFLQSIGSLTSLKILSLYNCSLAGTLPAQELTKILLL